MTAPLMTRKFDLYARTFALGDRTAEGLDQRLNVCEDDGSKRRLGEDRGERLAVACVHGGMIAQGDITMHLAVMLRSL